MSGTTKGDARIHDPLAARTGTNWPAFGLNDLNETGDNTRLDPLASIYPRAMRERIRSTGRPELYAATYNVTATSFDVKGVDKTYQWGGAKVYRQRGHWPA